MTESEAAPEPETAPSVEIHERDTTARELELTALRALAHPLRVRIMQELSNFGPFTSSGLAERLGESSGTTSYHLRQLARHAIIREVEGMGSARERWWEISPGDVILGSSEARGTAAGREATDIIARQWQTENQRLLDDYIRHGPSLLGPDWESATKLTTAHLKLTRDQLNQLGEEFLDFLARIEKRFATAEAAPGEETRPVQIQFNAFPLVDTANGARAVAGTMDGRASRTDSGAHEPEGRS